MPNYRALSEIIQRQIQQANQVYREHPPIAEESVTLGLDMKYEPPTADYYITGVFRWGVSTWGVDPIIGVSFPSDL